MVLLSLLIFIVTSSIHLYASFNKNRKLRAFSKILIMPSLLIYYVFKTNSIETYFILALLFSWFGDLFLILKGNKYFAFGGISFGLSHIFFIISYINKMNNMYIPFYIYIIAIIYFIITLIVFKHLKKYLPKQLIAPMCLYLLTNATMNCFAFILFSNIQNIYSLIIYIGALSFFISDTNLFFVRFKKEDNKQNHFIVMLTYIVAEFLIVFGYINL